MPYPELLTPHVVAALTALSVATMVASALLMPWLLTRIPADYFRHPKPHLIDRIRAGHPVQAVLVVLKNLVGLAVLGAGIAMLVLPGQGLLTILVGIILIDFPGKLRVERRLVGQPRLLAAVNWLRRRRGHPPLEL